jgi:hypothetical protein
MFQLGTQTGDAEPLELPSGELVLVGRGEACGVVVEDPSASRVHCRLLSRDGKVFLTDAGSRWGTFVNGQRVADCELRTGDEITIGETVLRLEATGSPQATTLARQSEVRRPLADREEPVAWPTRPDAEFPGAVTGERLAVAAIGTAAAVDREVQAEQADAHSPANDTEDECFAGYRLRRKIARSASGVIYLASKSEGNRDVAVKIFDQSVLCEDVDRRRFARAIELTRGLRHPHLVEMLDAGIDNDRCYTVSEFVDGENAAELIQRIGVVGMLDWRTTLRIARDMASALQFAFESDILHRNIAPRNILIRRRDGVALLNDLLLAKSLGDNAGKLTQPGDLAGTIVWLSPEQVGSGQPVDHRSDLYQLGATLYALLTGRPPAEGRNPGEIVGKILHETPPLPTRTHLAVPALMEGVVMRLLEKRPDDRFSSATALARELERVGRYLGESTARQDQF